MTWCPRPFVLLCSSIRPMRQPQSPRYALYRMSHPPSSCESRFLMPRPSARSMPSALERERPDALFVAGDAFFASRAVQFATLTARGRIPATYSLREYAAVGGLMSYGTDFTDSFRQVVANRRAVAFGTLFGTSAISALQTGGERRGSCNPARPGRPRFPVAGDTHCAPAERRAQKRTAVGLTMIVCSRGSTNQIQRNFAVRTALFAEGFRVNFGPSPNSTERPELSGPICPGEAGHCIGVP